MGHIVKVDLDKYPDTVQTPYPKGTGFWGEETISIRIPESAIPAVIDLMHEFVESNNLGEKAKNHLYEMEGDT